MSTGDPRTFAAAVTPKNKKPSSWDWQRELIVDAGIARHLISLVPFWGSSLASFDLARKEPLSLIDGSLETQSVGSEGLRLQTAASLTEQGTKWPSGDWMPTDQVTILLHKNKLDATDRQNYTFAMYDGSTPSNRLGAHLPWSNGSLFWDFGGTTTGTSRLAVTGLSYQDDYWVFNAGPRGMEVWQNGVLVGSHSGPVPTRTRISSNNFGVGSAVQHTLYGADYADYGLFAAFDKQLSQDQCAVSSTRAGMISLIRPDLGKLVPVAFVPAAGGEVLVAASGTYTLTGFAAATRSDHLMTAAKGDYTLSGKAAATSIGKTLTAGQGTYTLTGQDAGFALGTLAAAAGTYNLTGKAAVLSYTAAAVYPDVVSTTATAFAIGSTSHAVSMPATVLSGELLLVAITVGLPSAGVQLVTPSGWTPVDDTEYTNVSTTELGIYAKVADGTEDGTTVNFATTDSVTGVAHCFRVDSWGGTIATDIIVSSDVTSGGSGPNPGIHIFTWGASSTTVIALFGATNDDATVTGYPTGYSGTAGTVSGGGLNNGATIGSAWKEVSASSENPDPFSLSSTEASIAKSIAINSVGSKLIAAVGNYTLSGQPAIFRVSETMTAAAGNYTLTGNAANFLLGRHLDAAKGDYVLSGKDATTSKAAGTLLASAGTYTLTGQPANFLVGYHLDAETGYYTLTGQTVGFISGAAITDTSNIQLPIDYQFFGFPQGQNGDTPLTLRGNDKSMTARKLGRMLRF